VKNKDPPFRTAEVDIMYGEGNFNKLENSGYWIEKRYIDKAEAWYSYNGETNRQDGENAINVTS